MGKPKPFQNPRIEVVSEWIGTKKEWMDVTPDRLSAGDMIIGKGMIVAANMRELVDEGSFDGPVTRYKFTMKSGARLVLKGDVVVRAFTQGISPWLPPQSTPR